MDLTAALDLWSKYSSSEIDMTMHEKDTWTSRESYLSVGRQAAAAILRALMSAPAKNPLTVLDFGCGYGRNARHIRAMFPDATLYFSDLQGADFCAATFNGIETPTSTNLAELNIPKGMDLIWLGSVFTHFDREDCATLFGKLFDALSESGTVVFSQHGRKILQMATDGKYYMRPEYWSEVTGDYMDKGFGYHDIEGFNGWGQTLARPEESIALGIGRPDAALSMFAENAWCGHDIVAWTKLPSSKIVPALPSIYFTS